MGDSKQNRRLTMARFEKDMTQKDWQSEWEFPDRR